MKLLTRCLFPFLIAVPAVASAAPSETIEVISDKPAHKRPAKPNMALAVPEYSLNSQVFDFPTGFRIIMQSDRSHPYVALHMVIDHGNGDDPDGKDGTAHFAEHTWFRSVHGDLPPVMTLIQDLGVDMNATTWADITDYRTVASSEYLDLLLRLESLRLTEGSIGMTEDQVDIEREVVRNEWRRRNEQSGALAYRDYVFKSLFPEDHTYNSEETNESLDNIDLATLQKWFADYYTPDNATLVVIGDFDAAEARSLIFKNFDLSLLHPDLKEEHLFRYPRPGIENPDPDNEDHWLTDAYDPNDTDEPFKMAPLRGPRVTEAQIPLPPPPDNSEIREYKAAIDYRTVIVAWAVPGGFRKGSFEMDLLSATTQQAIGSSLDARGLLDTDETKRGLRFGGCGHFEMKVHSVILCGLEVTDKKRWPDPERVADQMLDQLSEVWNPEAMQINQKFYSRGRMSQLASILRSVDNVALHFGGRAEYIGLHAHQTGSVTYHSDAMNEVMNADFGRVAKLGYDLLRRDRAAIVLVDPIPKSEIDTSASTSSYEGASASDTVVSAAESMRKVAPEEIAGSYIKPHLTGLKDRMLPNGMRVVVVPHGESPLVEATLVMGGGENTAPNGLHGFAVNFTDDAWRDGSNDPLQIAAARTGGTYPNLWSTGVRAPAGNLSGALWFLREEMETKRPDLGFRSYYLRSVKRSVVGGFHNVAWHISDLRQRHLAPDARQYAATSWRDYEDVQGFTGAQIRAHMDRMLQPGNTTLLIVGNIDPDESLRMAVEYFAGWEPTGGVPNERMPIMPAPAMGSGSKILLFDDEKRTQSDVSFRCRVNFEGVADVQAVSVLSNYLRDRTFSQLRVKEGLAYSPGGFAFSSPDGVGILGFESLAINTGVGRTVEFFQELTAAVEAGKVDDDTLTIYQLRRARNLGIKAQSTNQLTSKLVDAVMWDQPWTHLTDAGEHIANVDAKQINRLVDGCTDRSIITIRGPLSVIQPQLDERGISYEVIDWQARGDEIHAAADAKGYKKHKKEQAKAEKKKAKEEGEETTEDGSADTE